jgi:hypothetical protein
MCPDGDHDGRVTRGYLFNCLQPAEPILGTRGSSGAALSQKVGAGAQVTNGGPVSTPTQEVGAGVVGARGGLGAASSREAGTGAIGICGSPRAALSQEAGGGATGTRGGLGDTSSREAGAIVLT